MLNSLPDIEFVKKDINDILSEMIKNYEDAYYEQTGIRKKLYPSDPLRIFLHAQALRELQLRILIDDGAKQNLLKYSRENNLDNLGVFQGVRRLPSNKAQVKIKFILSAPQSTVQTIPAGTRVSPGSDIYFEVVEEIEVAAGLTEITAITECVQEGVIGNNFLPGQINILVDPLPWISEVENIEESQGGAETETDTNLKERIRIAPESYSVAGPEGAYEYWTKEYNVLVSDVKVLSPSPGAVDVRVLLQNGQLPNESFLEGLKDYLSASNRRPLTDFVETNQPDLVQYNIDLTYFIRAEDGSQSDYISGKINQAINDYVVWQKSKIGRDINPSELIARIIQAGAKRVEIVSPFYTPIDKGSVAQEDEISVHFGGIEDE